MIRWHDSSPKQADQTDAKAPPGEALLINTPVDELVRQSRALLRWVWQLKWWLLFGAVLGAGTGAVLGLTVLRTHTALAMMRVLSVQHENPLGDFERSAVRFYHSPLNSFPAETLVIETMQRLDGAAPSPKDLYETQRKLEILDFGNDIYRVGFRDRDPERALTFLSTHLQVYKEHELERNLGSLQREVDRLRSTMQDVETRMLTAEERIRAFKAEHADALPEFADSNLSNLRALERLVLDLEAQAEDLRIERRHVQQQLQSEPELVVMQTTRQESASRLASKRNEVANLRASGLSERHPRLLQALTELRVLQDTLDPNDTVSTEQVPNDLHRQLRLRDGEIQIAIEQTDRQLKEARARVREAEQVLAKAPALEQQYAQLYRNQESDLDAYEQIRLVHERAQLQLRLEQDAAESRLEVFNPPRLQFSSRLAFLAVCGIGGMMLGLALIGGIAVFSSLRRLIWPGGITTGTTA